MTVDADVDTVFGVPAVWSAAPAGLLALDGFSAAGRLGVARFAAAASGDARFGSGAMVLAVDWRVAYSGEPTTDRCLLGRSVCHPVGVFDASSGRRPAGMVYAGTADDLRVLIAAAAVHRRWWSKLLPLIDRLEWSL